MAAVDRAAVAAGTASLALMERAGRAVADAVARRARPGERVLVLCGPGSNGGDGFVAARLLQQRGYGVALALAGERDALSGDAGEMAARWQGDVSSIASARPAMAGIVVDALFGAGLNRPLAGETAALVDRVNASDAAVIAVDVPSGLSGESGLPLGPTVRADETVTFFRLKPGHLLQPGRELCGVVTLADIGILPEVAFGPLGVPVRTFRNDPALWRPAWPRLDSDTHKYRRGSALVLAGGLGGVGASRLAARAALRIGAGLVTVACRPEALAAHAARGPDALIQRAFASPAELEGLLSDQRLGAVLAGPALGLDASASAALDAVLRCGIPTVLDADALTMLSRRTTSLAESIAPLEGRCVLTPHEGEFKRLFDAVPGIAKASSKLDRARRAAALSGATVVLKGSDTVIAAADGRAAINGTGSPALATAGSGDVLGGLVAGLMARGMPTFEASCAAVWLHGKAGEHCGPGLIADDLPEAVKDVVPGDR